LLNQLLKPKINWRQMLAITLRSAIKYDYTFTRLSRRSWSSGLILPGQNVTEKVSAVAALDGSASTTQEMITEFLSECRGVMQSFRDYELTVLTFDTEVYGVKTFTPYNMNEINSYKFTGGGGTRPSCVWDYLKENKIKPDRLLLFTDGEVGGDWGEKDYCSTLFVVHSNPVVAPYGRTCAYP
jgi:predicted metal-dependent peptidase